MPPLAAATSIFPNVTPLFAHLIHECNCSPTSITQAFVPGGLPAAPYAAVPGQYGQPMPAQGVPYGGGGYGAPGGYPQYGGGQGYGGIPPQQGYGAGYHGYGGPQQPGYAPRYAPPAQQQYWQPGQAPPKQAQAPAAAAQGGGRAASGAAPPKQSAAAPTEAKVAAAAQPKKAAAPKEEPKKEEPKKAAAAPKESKSGGDGGDSGEAAAPSKGKEAASTKEAKEPKESKEAAAAAAPKEKAAPPPLSEEDLAKLNDKRDHMNIIFTGHVDAGKSTIGGHLMYLTGGVDKRTLEKYERDAKEMNRESWYLVSSSLLHTHVSHTTSSAVCQPACRWPRVWGSLVPSSVLLTRQRSRLWRLS